MHARIEIETAAPDSASPARRRLEENELSDRFVIEADQRVVGVAVRDARGFSFFTSNPHFKPLEGKTFRRARALIRRVEEIAALRRRARAAGLH
jgi:hypothetical protein